MRRPTRLENRHQARAKTARSRYLLGRLRQKQPKDLPRCGRKKEMSASPMATKHRYENFDISSYRCLYLHFALLPFNTPIGGAQNVPQNHESGDSIGAGHVSRLERQSCMLNQLIPEQPVNDLSCRLLKLLGKRRGRGVKLQKFIMPPALTLKSLRRAMHLLHTCIFLLSDENISHLQS